jgi:nitroimidazol reductase NimA-like FMN-containing flavoprotein (pyridoxamine 5'-phosphate oxidase superfamily)
MNDVQPTSKTVLKRLPERGSFEPATIKAILDEAFICHVGFCVDGQPFVIPTSYARIRDQLFIHGSAISRMQRSLASGIPACVTVTLVDGLVLARSAFHHSINYRSVVIFGKMSLVVEEHEKMAALRAFTEHIIPGRWKDVREPNTKELKATSVLRMPLTEVSAKIRVGDPKDDEVDHSLAVWAGQLPLKTVTAEPIADAFMPNVIPVPDYVARYDRKMLRRNLA